MNTFSLDQLHIPDIDDLLISHAEEPVKILLNGGKKGTEWVETFYKWILFNKPFWLTAMKYNIPITKELSIWDGLVTDQSVADYQTRIYDSVLELGGGEHPPTLFRDIIETVNSLYNSAVMELGSHHSSISAYQLAKLMLYPEIEELREKNRTLDPGASTRVNELTIKDTHIAANTILEQPFPENVLYPFHRLAAINRQQLPQTMISMGFRADIDDRIVRYPLRHSFMDGMQSDAEFCIDTLAAKISTFYNKLGMPDAQYSNRQQQLITVSLPKFYPGDCGSDKYIEFFISPKFVHFFIGKNIITPKGLVTITSKNLQEFAGKVVKMRSPLTCRCTDGVCEACGGRMTRYMSHGTNMGITSTIELTEPISQLILSSKHFSRTNATAYVLPTELRDIFQVSANDIYINEEAKTLINTMDIGVPFDYVRSISDLIYVSSKDTINEEHFSSVDSIVLRDHDSKNVITSPLTLKIEDQSSPFFTRDFLWFIKEHKSEIEVGDIVWIPMKSIDIEKPILRCQVVNYSMRRYAKQIEQFLNRTLSTYESAPMALTDFSNLIYTKISKNIYHLEMLLRGYMVTDETNYRIPVVTDPSQVMFGKTRDIIMNRTLSAQLAFERHEKMCRDPRTYLYTRQSCDFDFFFGYAD